MPKRKSGYARTNAHICPKCKAGFPAVGDLSAHMVNGHGAAKENVVNVMDGKDAKVDQDQRPGKKRKGPEPKVEEQRPLKIRVKVGLAINVLDFVSVLLEIASSLILTFLGRFCQYSV